MPIKHIAIATLASMALIVLAGCGGGESGADSTAADETPEVRVEVSGDVESTLTASGSIYCGAGEGADPDYMFELYVVSSPETLNLRLNRALAAGTHPIVGSGDSARNQGADAYFYYRGPDRARFDQATEGSIKIDNMPTQRGESLVATVKAALNDDDGHSINLTAELNVAAGRQTFDECP